MDQAFIDGWGHGVAFGDPGFRVRRIPRRLFQLEPG
jgi:hypothetical protein